MRMVVREFKSYLNARFSVSFIEIFSWTMMKFCVKYSAIIMALLISTFWIFSTITDDSDFEVVHKGLFLSISDLKYQQAWRVTIDNDKTWFLDLLHKKVSTLLPGDNLHIDSLIRLGGKNCTI